MNELYEICNYYYDKLLINQDDMTFNSKVQLIQEVKHYELILNENYQNLITGVTDLRNLIDYCKIGSVVNYDLLIDLLLTIHLPNQIKGFFEKNCIEKAKVTNFYKGEWDNNLYEISKLLKIYMMLNRIITFIRKEYDFTFLSYPYLPINNQDDENINKLLSEINAVANYRLNNKMTISYNKFTTSEEVINYINELKIIYDDMLSTVIDNYEINQAIVKELKLISSKFSSIKIIMEKHRVLHPNNIELQIYMEFVDKLIMYLQLRIEKLDYKRVDKVIIKEFFTY